MTVRMRILVGTVCVVASVAFALPSGAQIQSKFTATPPTIDGTIGSTEWSSAGSLMMADGTTYGTVHFLNDNAWLYVAFDVYYDTIENDNPDPDNAGFDLYEFVFDVDRDGVPDENLDGGYIPCTHPGPNYGNLASRVWVTDAQTCAVSECNSTSALVAHGFGASPGHPTSHRMWELAIPFSEIQAQAGENVRVGLMAASDQPSFYWMVPDFTGCDLTDFLTLELGSSAAVPALTWWGIGLLALLVAAVGTIVGRRIF